MGRWGMLVAAALTYVVAVGCAAQTDPASRVGALTATLNAHGHTDASSASYWFQYATSRQALGTGFGSQTPTRGPIAPNVPGHGGDLSFAEDVGGLDVGTSYYYRVCGKDGQIHGCSDTGSFTTASTPSFSEYPAPSDPSSLVPGPDGALWFADDGGGSIGRIATTGNITQYPLPAGDTASSIAGAFDGALWFTDPTTNSIGRMTTSGAVSEHPVPTASAGLGPIISGPDTALWFTESKANKIGRISLQGAITEYPLPTPGSAPTTITQGPDGALWFDERRSYIGRITTGGIISEHPVSSPPNFIVTGSDKALWFLLGNSSDQRLARMTTGGAVTSYPASVPYITSGLISGPDGALWYTSSECESICVSSLARTTTNGQSTNFDLTSLGSASVGGLASGPDGAIWLFSDGGGYGSSRPGVIRAG